MTTKNPYAVLQVSPRAEAAVIKGAYRALMQAHTPDRGGSESRAKDINAAYELLSDPGKRKAFDETGRPGEDAVVGNYRIIREIAVGGFGTTYEAEHVITGGKACLKHCLRVSDEYNDVLIKEALALWDLAHFSLPAMRDVIKLDDGSLVLAMTFMKGLTVEQVVKKVGRMDSVDVAWIVERILNALLYLHFHAVVHGDLKPQNVIVDDEVHAAYLIDFGLANVRPTGADRAHGFTEDFSPPEQIASAYDRARRPLIPASDFYSLGMLMIFMLGGGMDAVKKALVPSNVPAPMQGFIRSLIARDPMARPQGDIFDLFKRVRLESFGKARSGMRRIAGL